MNSVGCSGGVVIISVYFHVFFSFCVNFGACVSGSHISHLFPFFIVNSAFALYLGVMCCQGGSDLQQP